MLSAQVRSRSQAMHRPQRRSGIAVIEVVFVVANIVVVDALHDRLVAVVVRQVQIRAPPGSVGAEAFSAAIVFRKEFRSDLSVGPRRPEVVQFSWCRLPSCRNCRRATRARPGSGRPPARPPGTDPRNHPHTGWRAGFLGSSMIRNWRKVGLGRLHAGQVEQPEPDRLKHALLAPVPEVALLNAGAQIQLRPVGLILLAVVIPHLESRARG